MNLLRRKFLKTATYVGATASAIGAGVLIPQRVLGAYNTAAFEAKDVNGAISATMGTDQHTASDAVKLKAPDIAENGAVVPVTVSSSMSDVEAISIVATGNAQPLTLVRPLFQPVSKWVKRLTSSR
jgi:sulfur-oxidizing protein SoxY